MAGKFFTLFLFVKKIINNYIFPISMQGCGKDYYGKEKEDNNEGRSG